MHEFVGISGSISRRTSSGIWPVGTKPHHHIINKSFSPIRMLPNNTFFVRVLTAKCCLNVPLSFYLLPSPSKQSQSVLCMTFTLTQLTETLSRGALIRDRTWPMEGRINYTGMKMKTGKNRHVKSEVCMLRYCKDKHIFMETCLLINNVIFE